MFDAILLILVAILLALEIRWSNVFLKLTRVALSAVAVVILTGSRDLGPASRRALEQPQRVEMGPDGFKRVTSDYASGVMVMKREAEKGLSDISVPTVVLALLTLSPIFGPGRRFGNNRGDSTSSE